MVENKIKTCEIQSYKNNIVSDEIIRKKYTKAELIRTISEQTGNNNIKGTVEDIHNLARLNNIPIEYEMRKTKEGWLGTPKGMLEVLFERGFIDTQSQTKEEAVSYYTVNGQKDDKSDPIQCPD